MQSSGSVSRSECDLGVKALLTIGDVAAVLDVSTKTVKRWVRAGLVPPPVAIGSKKRWPQAVFLAWLKAGCPKSV